MTVMDSPSYHRHHHHHYDHRRYTTGRSRLDLVQRLIRGIQHRVWPGGEGEDNNDAVVVGIDPLARHGGGEEEEDEDCGDAVVFGEPEAEAEAMPMTSRVIGRRGRGIPLSVPMSDLGE